MKCSNSWKNAKQLPGSLSALNSGVRLRDLLQGSLGEKKENFREIKGKLYHQLYHNGIRQLCKLLLDRGVSFQDDGEAGAMIAVMMRDFLLRAS